MKLDGLRVIDLGMYLPTPVITQMMADHGADVIRIEPPHGEPTRHQGGIGPDGEPIWFNATHRGKRSVALNLKSPEDREALYRLAEQADVVIESFRPGVVKKLGIDAEALRARNPRLVYCSLSAFGQSGPLGPLPGHDMAAQAYTGFVSLNGRPGSPPVVPGAPTADMVSGMTAFTAILMALYRREKTGQGDAIDIAMYDSLMAWTPHFLSFVQADREGAPKRLTAAVAGFAFYAVYETSDGRAVTLAGMEPHYIQNFLTAIDREDLIPAALTEPGPEQDRVTEELRALFLTRDYAHWCAFLETIDISWAPVLTMVEAYDHPHAKARDMLVSGGNWPVLGTPFKFAEEPGTVRLGAPKLDEHRAQVLEHGFGAKQEIQTA